MEQVKKSIIPITRKASTTIYYFYYGVNYGWLVADNGEVLYEDPHEHTKRTGDTKELSYMKNGILIEFF